MNGRSYQAVFEAGLSKRVKRTSTARQLYLSGLIYTPVQVNRWGQVVIDNWTYGAPDTQNDLLLYHKKGEEVLLGRDPDDFTAPALAWNAKNELICEGNCCRHAWVISGGQQPRAEDIGAAVEYLKIFDMRGK